MSCPLSAILHGCAPSRESVAFFCSQNLGRQKGGQKKRMDEGNSVALRKRKCKWLWVKNRYPKWNPGKWKHGPKLAVPWWLNFDPYPNQVKQEALPIVRLHPKGPLPSPPASTETPTSRRAPSGAVTKLRTAQRPARTASLRKQTKKRSWKNLQLLSRVCSVCFVLVFVL